LKSYILSGESASLGAEGEIMSGVETADVLAMASEGELLESDIISEHNAEEGGYFGR
jgi:hypothetical protein